MIQVLVLSPTPALRAGLRALLAGDPDLSVAAAASLAEWEELAAEPGVLPGPATGEASGKGGAACIIVATHGGVDLADPALNPGHALLLVTGEAREARALAGLELRAWGVISPETTAEALQAAVRALAEGLVVGAPEVLRRALQTPARAPVGDGEGAAEDEDAPLDPLTERESEVLLRLAQGLTNKQIALALGISEHTVKFHVSSIYTKFGVSNRTEAVRKGARRGLVPL